MKKLVYKKDDLTFVKDILMFDDYSKLKPALNKIGFEILKLLSKKEMYPLEISKELKINEQKIYYYVKKLNKSGIIEISNKKEINGALAKFYKINSSAFGVELPFGERDISGLSFESINEKLRNFFVPFIRGNFFDGVIVVGSPDKHGPFMSWARDGHYAIYVSMLIGNLGALCSEESVRLDVEARAEGKTKENMILIGGPGVNMVVSELSEFLPIQIIGESKGEAPRAVFGNEIYSKITGKKYRGEEIGYIIKQRNPFNKKKWVIILAGLGRKGTKAAVMAVTKFYDKVINDKDEITKVVKAYDLEGKGSVNRIEGLE